MTAPVHTLEGDDYHAHPAIGSTALRSILKSPRHYHAEYVARAAVREETPAMRLGTAVHCAVLEPEKWIASYAVAPDVDRRTKAGKEAYAAFVLESARKRILSHDEHAKAEAIAAAVRAHPSAAGLLAAGEGTEVPIGWTDDLSGVECKGKVDLVTRLGGNLVLVDLKTTKDASPDGFPCEVANWMLHVQAAHYIDGWRTAKGENPAAYVLIAVESAEPHVVGTYALPSDAIERGVDRRASALRTLVECRESGVWPGYGDEIQTVELPAWAA